MISSSKRKMEKLTNTSVGNVNDVQEKLGSLKIQGSNFTTLRNLFSLLWSPFSEPFGKPLFELPGSVLKTKQFMEQTYRFCNKIQFPFSLSFAFSRELLFRVLQCHVRSTFWILRQFCNDRRMTKAYVLCREKGGDRHGMTDKGYVFNTSATFHERLRVLFIPDNHIKGSRDKGCIDIEFCFLTASSLLCFFTKLLYSK